MPQEAITPVGEVRAFNPPVDGDPDFIGPSRRDWSYVDPTTEEMNAARRAAANGDVIVVEANPFEAIAQRERELDGRKRRSAGYLVAREKAGQWLAVNLSPRGISVGTLEALEDLEASIHVARQIAEGEKLNGLTPSVEDRIKAATAVAVGAKAHVEMTKNLLEQLKPEKKPDGNGVAAPRGPTRDQPVVPIQAGSVHMHFSGTDKNGNGRQDSPESQDSE